MILKLAELDAIRSGRISLVFRRWFRPTVKAGGSLKTAIGVLRIEDVLNVERAQINEQHAAAAGYASLGQLLLYLDAREGEITCIKLHYEGVDPRIALREDDHLSSDQLNEVLAKLRRLDDASSVGAWTLSVLQIVERHPKMASTFLAKKAGREQLWLKTNIRKLKNLGLTISHDLGYELSPRGRVVLAALSRRA